MQKNLLSFALLFITLVSMSYCFASPMVFTSRGVIYAPKYRAQEDTMDAFIGVRQWNQDHPSNKITGVEMHIVVIKPKNAGDAPIFVCSHDEDLIDLTGQHINIHNLSLQEIKNLEIKQNLDNVDYGRTRRFTFFADVLNEFMKEEPPFMIWLSVKDKDYLPLYGSSYTAIETIKALKTWRAWYLENRHVDIFKHMMVSSDNPFVGYALYQLSIANGLDKLGLEIFPNHFYKIPDSLEKIFNMNSHWVALKKDLITATVIQKYHAQGKKVLGWDGVDERADYYSALDAVLVYY